MRKNEIVAIMLYLTIIGLLVLYSFRISNVEKKIEGIENILEEYSKILLNNQMGSKRQEKVVLINNKVFEIIESY